METVDGVLKQVRQTDKEIAALQNLRARLLEVMHRVVIDEAGLTEGTEIYVQGRAYVIDLDRTKVNDDGTEVRISVYATPRHGNRKPSMVAYVNREQLRLLPLPEEWRHRRLGNA